MALNDTTIQYLRPLNHLDYATWARVVNWIENEPGLHPSEIGQRLYFELERDDVILLAVQCLEKAYAHREYKPAVGV